MCVCVGVCECVSVWCIGEGRVGGGEERQRVEVKIYDEIEHDKRMSALQVRSNIMQNDVMPTYVTRASLLRVNVTPPQHTCISHRKNPWTHLSLHILVFDMQLE